MELTMGFLNISRTGQLYPHEISLEKLGKRGLEGMKASEITLELVSNRPLNPAVRADLHYMAALHDISAGEEDLAIPHIENVLSIVPGYEPAKRGYSHYNQHNFPRGDRLARRKTNFNTAHSSRVFQRGEQLLEETRANRRVVAVA